MTILITGVAGLIGGRLAAYFIENYPDYQVVGIDDLSGGYIENVDKHVIFYKRDLAKDYIDDIFLTYKPDIVYHFACYAAEGLSPFMRKFNYSNNIGSTVNIINECINFDVKKLVYASSMSVYGHGPKDGNRFDEELKQCPIDPYGVSKYACEMDIQIAGEQHGLDWVIIRPHNCYSDDTEILTENGWKLFKDLSCNEKVITLNTETMTMEYQVPTDYHKYYVSDKLYNFHKNGLDLLVTGDHNMVTRTSSKNKIQKITASEIYNNPKKYYYYQTLKNGYLYDSGISDDIVIDEVCDSLGSPMDNAHQNGGKKIIKAEDWFRFFGWFLSEGSMYKTKQNYSINISQYKDKNPENYNEIVNDIHNIGFNCYCNGNNIIINSKQLYMYLKKYFPISSAHTKYIPREFLNYNSNCLVNLFDTMMKGDGNKDSSRYSTVSKQLADDFSELCLKIGKCSSIFSEESNGHVIYRCGILKNTNPSFGDTYTKNINCDLIQYEGYVYDITVPNHIIYVRRNGKSCWGSNCFGIGQNIWDKYRNVLGIWMYQTLHDEPMLIYGDGKQTRAFSYIDNCLPCFAKAGLDDSVSKTIINLGGIKGYTINEACQMLSNITGYNKVVHMEPRHEVKYAVPTYQKSIDVLDYKEDYTFEYGLKEMWEWAKKQPDRLRKKWDNYEISKKIYQYWKT